MSSDWYTFGLEVTYDGKTGEPVAAYVRVRAGRVAETREVVHAFVFADYGEDGKLIGVEMLGMCDDATLAKLAEGETDAVKKFLGGGLQRVLLVR